MCKGNSSYFFYIIYLGKAFRNLAKRGKILRISDLGSLLPEEQ